MNRGRIALVSILMLALTAAACGLARAAESRGAGPLDGRRFAGETGEKGKAKGDKEDFLFADGRFDPLGCHQWGFSAAPYTARSEGGAVHFEAETVSPKEGSMVWKGQVHRDILEGTMVWRKAGQEPIESWFKGELQQRGPRRPGPLRRRSSSASRRRARLPAPRRRRPRPSTSGPSGSCTWRGSGGRCAISIPTSP